MCSMPPLSPSPIDLLIPHTCAACDRPCHLHPLCHRCMLPPPLAIDSKGSLEGTNTAHYCERCFFPSEQSGICSSCNEHPSSVRAERYLWRYEDQVRDAIRAAKFKPRRGLTLWFARSLFLHGIRLFPTLDWSHVAFVPGSPHGVRARGFDQAEVMASHVGFQLNLLVLRHIIHRSRTSVPQSELGHSNRIVNGTRAFSLAPKTRLTKGARVLLIDDVSTTGISTHTIARLLRLSGAAAVDVLTLARSHSWDQYYRARAFLRARV